ncbi:hypothetical protein J4573_16640 [Actinomadura barringtoniae]|uniref:Uncharacterized protein n=1 Tax=Actinomadura barringtoniae TaxID=1427535 RepID=A0A939T6X2_9ACTN|nr:hypothetical protein [Actinomadura barringtoniae]MBO2448732.1 hypothetical protein [Actinomadura barringtoniae]
MIEGLWPPQVPLWLRWRFRRRVAECRTRLEMARDEALNEWPELSCEVFQVTPRHMPRLHASDGPGGGLALLGYSESGYVGPGWGGAPGDRPDKAARYLIDTVWTSSARRPPLPVVDPKQNPQ